MVPQKKKENKGSLPASFTTGAIALVFLIIGFEAALFVHKAAVTRLVANRDQPDTVYVYVEPEAVEERAVPAEQNSRPMSTSPKEARTVRKNASHSPEAVSVREKAAPRPVETFRFNPNTVSVEDLQRLGFSEKQALSIDNYRQKGGRFRRPSDFARSYVVADSVFARLEPFIDIPRIDINMADSTTLLTLPGIGPFFAGKMVQYRTQLGGYSSLEQLMEIYHFDEEKFTGLQDLITCSEPEGFALWTLSEADLAKHPYISRSEAHGIVLFRTHHAPSECTVEALRKAGVLSPDHAAALARCRIAPAQ